MRGKSRFWVIGSIFVLAATMALVAAGARPRAVVAQTAAGAETLLSDAQRFEREGDLDRAFRQYELIVEQFPESAVTPRALLALGQGRWSRGEVDAARAATANLRSAYPRSPSAAGAFVLEGDIALARAQGPAELSAARDAFAGVPRLFEASEYPALEWRALAFLKAPVSSACCSVSSTRPRRPFSRSSKTSRRQPRPRPVDSAWQRSCSSKAIGPRLARLCSRSSVPVPKATVTRRGRSHPRPPASVSASSTA